MLASAPTGRRAGWLLSALVACAPSSPGDLVDAQGAQSLLVLGFAEDEVVRVEALELSGSEDAVWLPRAPGVARQEVLRYGCGLAALGLPSGDLPLDPAGRALPAPAEGARPEVRVRAPLPDCRPTRIRSVDLGAEVGWLTASDAGAWVGAVDGEVYGLRDGEVLERLSAAPSLLGVPVPGGVRLFFEGGRSRAWAASGPLEAPRQHEDGLWRRWMAGTSTRGVGFVLTDRGARLEVEGARVDASGGGEELGAELLVAPGRTAVWYAAAGSTEIAAFQGAAATVEAPPGRLTALAEIGGALWAATEQGSLLVRRDGAWAEGPRVDGPVLGLAPAGSSAALAVTAAGEALVIDLALEAVCASATSPGPVARAAAGQGRLHIASGETPGRIWTVERVDGRACPGP